MDGACIDYHDPFSPRIRLGTTLFGSDDGVTLGSVPLTPERLADSDCIVILVRHSNVDYSMILEHGNLVFDAVNATGGRSGKALVERL
jgi:hypothetical protein